MSKRIKGITIELDGNTTGLDKALSNVNKQSREVTKELREVERALKFNPGNAELVAQKQRLLGDQIQNTKEKLTQLKDAKADVDKQFAEGKINQSQYDAFQREIIETESKLKHFETQLATSKSKLNAFGESAIEAGKKMKSAGDSMTSIGKDLSMKVTAPIVAVGTLATKAAIDFESAFAGVRKTVDATEGEFGVLSDGIRKMAKEIPAAATEIAGVAEAAGQLGIKKEAILGFTRTMVDLGVATNMSSEEAATALARLANITGMNQKDFDRLGSSVVDLGNNFATTEKEIVDMALRLAGAGAQVGMSEADILGLSTALTSVGINAEMGGSAFSRVMVKMQLATSSGFTEVQKVMKTSGKSLRELQMMASHSGKAFGNLAEDLGMTKVELKALLDAGVDLEGFAKIAGMTGEEFKQAFEKDAVGAIGHFISGLANAEESGDTAINLLQEMGITSVLLRDSLLRAGGASELFASAVETSNNAWSENTALTKEAEQRYKTTASQIKIMVNYLKELGITLGPIILPIINSVIESMKPLIERFADMSETSQKAILAMAGIAAAIGPVLVVAGVLVSSLGAVLTAVGTVSGAIAVVTTGVAAATPAVGALAAIFTVLTGPVGLAIAAIAGVAIGVGILVNHISKDAIPEVERFGEGVSESTQKALGSFFELSDGVSQSMAELTMTTGKVTEEMKNDMVGKYSEMNAQITEGLKKRHGEEIVQLQEMFANTSTLSDKEEHEILQKKQTNHEKEVEYLAFKEKKIKEILTQASAENRGLTEREIQIINNINEQAQEKAVKILSDSEMEQKIILERMKDSASDLSAKQAAEVVKNSAEQRNKSVAEAEGQYNETYAAIVRMHDETGEITAEQATKLIAEAKRSRDESVKYAESTHNEVVSEAKAQANEHVDHVDWETGEILSKWEVYKNGVIKKVKETNKESIADFKRWGAEHDAWYNSFRDKATEGWKNYFAGVAERVRTTNSESLADFKRWGSSYNSWYAGHQERATAGWTKYGSDVLAKIKKTNSDSIADFKRWGQKIYEVISGAWNKVMTFFGGISLIDTGKDIVSGLIKGIDGMFGKVKEKVEGLANLIPTWARDMLGIKSPSRVMMEVGGHIGDGLALGIESTKSVNQKAIEGVAKVISAAVKKNANEIVKIDEENEKKRIEIKNDYAKKRAELTRKSAQSSQSALKTHKNKKGEIVTTGEQRVLNIRADASAKLTKLNEDEQKKLIATNDKYWNQMQKKEAELSKDKLEAVKTYVADKKSLDELSSVAESEVWRKSLVLFKEGTKERVEIQKAYQASLKAINDEVTKVNDEYAGKMSVINDRLRKEEDDLTKAYEKSLDDRAKSLTNFVGVFDFFEVKIEKTGQDLMNNLTSQIHGFTRWQQEIEEISKKAIDKGLLDELRAMGPKALPELIALNSLTDKQLTEYSAMYQKKSALARQQAERELIGMKSDTEKRIIDLRIAANKELDTLRADWVMKIQSITKATDAELMSLKSIGRNAGQGLYDGLASMESSLVRKAREIANAVSAAMANALKIKSPSRVTMEIGQFVGEGLADGMENSLASIKQAARNMASATIPNIGRPESISQSANVNGPNRNSAPVINQVVNIHSPEHLSPSETARLQKRASQELVLGWR